MNPLGELLWSGCVQFPAGTGANGIVGGKFIDVPRLLDQEFVELIVRNGSASDDITVKAGHVAKLRPYPKVAGPRLVATATAATDILTCTTPHTLSVGDRVAFQAGSGLNGLTADTYYYVIDPTGLMTEFVFQVSATPGGGVFNLTAADTVSFVYVPSPTDTIPSANGVVLTDVYNCASYHGLTVGDAVILNANATVDVVVVNTVYYVIATASALQFQISASRGGTTLDVALTTAVPLKLVNEFYTLTSFTVPKWAAASATASIAGMESRIIQGFARGENGGRILVVMGDQTYALFTVSIEIRRT